MTMKSIMGSSLTTGQGLPAALQTRHSRVELSEAVKPTEVLAGLQTSDVVAERVEHALSSSELNDHFLVLSGNVHEVARLKDRLNDRLEYNEVVELTNLLDHLRRRLRRLASGRDADGNVHQRLWNRSGL